MLLEVRKVISPWGGMGGENMKETHWVFGYMGVCSLQNFIKVLHSYIICTFSVHIILHKRSKEKRNNC